MVLRRGAEPEVLVGVINLFTLQRREFSEDEIAFLQTVAGELAIGIENARLYGRTDARLQRKITELGTMQRVSHTIASTLDLEDVLRLIAEQAVALFNVEAAAIFRFPGRSGDPPEPPTVGYRAGRAKDVVDEPGRDEVIREVMRTGRLAPSIWTMSMDRADSSVCRSDRLASRSARSVSAWLPMPSSRKMSLASCKRSQTPQPSLLRTQRSTRTPDADSKSPRHCSRKCIIVCATICKPLRRSSRFSFVTMRASPGHSTCERRSVASRLSRPSMTCSATSSVSAAPRSTSSPATLPTRRMGR